MGVLDLLCTLLHTMKAFFTLLCVALASARNVHVKIDQLEYGFCDGSAEPATIDALAVEPFPIVIATGETITLTVEITLNEVVPVTMTVTTCWSKVQTLSALLTSLMARNASCP